MILKLVSGGIWGAQESNLVRIELDEIEIEIEDEIEVSVEIEEP